MTTPVITSVRIEMPSSVLSDAPTMSFVLPVRFPAGAVPKPLDSHVTIKDSTTNDSGYPVQGLCEGGNSEKRNNPTPLYPRKNQD